MPAPTFTSPIDRTRAFLPARVILLLAFGALLAFPFFASAQPGDDVRVMLIYKNADPREVLQALAEQTGIDPPAYKGDASRKITVNIRDETFSQAMNKIAEAAGLTWWRSTDDEFILGTNEDLDKARADGQVATPRVPGPSSEPGSDEEAQEATGEAQQAPGEAAAAPGAAVAPVEEEPTVTAVFKQGKIEQVLLALSQQAGVRITPEGKASGLRVDVIAKDTPLTEALDMIAQPKGLVWWKKKDGSYGIADKAYYEQEVLPGNTIQRIFRPDHIRAEDFETAIKGILTPKIGKVAVDPRTNKVIVTDLPAVIELIERLLQEIDVQLVTRVFQIHYADVEEIAQQIEDYKSGPGTIKVDPKTHQIIVTDLLQNILRMEKLIDVLDIGPEIIVYDVNNIGLDGEELQEIEAIIDNIRTKDLMFEINIMQGTFILEDVPQVHDKVEKILKAFDKPIKQILLEAEILTTTFQSTFGYQFDWIYSEDLLSAASDGLVTLPGTPGDDGYANLDETFPLFSSASGIQDNGRGISVINLTKEALLRLQAAMTDKSTNVLQQPRLLVKNQETARILVGREEPYLTTFFNDYNTNVGRSTFTQNYVTAGLTLELTPSISNNGLVELEVDVSDDDATRITVNAGETIGNVELIRRDRKEANTVLIIPDGETRMIGGLLRNSKTETTTGIPYVSRIPLIGPLFGGWSKDDIKQNLMIFLTPTIVQERGKALTEEGRRGRLLTLEELQEEGIVTSPTLMLEEGERTGEEAEYEPATLTSEPASSSIPYLLGHEDTTDEETEAKGPRETSYTATPGSPVGSITETVGAVTVTEGEEPPPPEEAAPDESRRVPPPETDEKGEAVAPPPAPEPVESETGY